MSIPNVAPEERITSAWGNMVADAINALSGGFTGAMLYGSSTTQSVPNGNVLTKATFGPTQLAFDSALFFDDANDALKVPVGLAGAYIIFATFVFNSVAVDVGERGVIQVNGAAKAITSYKTPSGGNSAGGSIIAPQRLADGDSVTLAVSHSSADASEVLTIKGLGLIRVGA